MKKAYFVLKDVEERPDREAKEEFRIMHVLEIILESEVFIGAAQDLNWAGKQKKRERRHLSVVEIVLIKVRMSHGLHFGSEHAQHWVLGKNAYSFLNRISSEFWVFFLQLLSYQYLPEA